MAILAAHVGLCKASRHVGGFLLRGGPILVLDASPKLRQVIGWEGGESHDDVDYGVGGIGSGGEVGGVGVVGSGKGATYAQAVNSGVQ